MCAVDNAPMLIFDIIKDTASLANQFYRIKVERDTSEINNEIMKEQAKKAEDEAGEARQAGIEEARNKRIQAILKMGDENAKAAKGNIAMTSANLLNINNDNKLNAELDALTTIKAADKAAQNYEEKADSIYSKYALNKFTAEKQYKSGLFTIGENLYNRTLTNFKKSK